MWRLATWTGLCLLLRACLVYGVASDEPALAAVGIALVPLLAAGGVRV